MKSYTTAQPELPITGPDANVVYSGDTQSNMCAIHDRPNIPLPIDNLGCVILDTCIIDGETVEHQLRDSDGEHVISIDGVQHEFHDTVYFGDYLNEAINQ